MDAPARHLLFHAIIVLLVGLFAGFPYGSAILRKKADDVVHAWRVAHNSLTLGAVLMMAVAAVLSSLTISPALQQMLVGAYVISGYGFAFALTVGPLLGEPGLTYRGPLSARVVFAGNVVGVGGSLAGTIALLYAAFVSL